MKATLLTLAAVFYSCLFASAANSAPLVLGGFQVPDPDRSVMTYDPADGSVQIYAPAGLSFTGLSLKSNSGQLMPDNLADPALFGGFLDIKRNNNIFKLSPSPDDFAVLNYGPVLPPGLSFADLAEDLDVSGALFPRGKAEDLGNPAGVGLYVPEPASTTMVVMGVVGLLVSRRRR